jgi:hypothetical protein
MIILLFCSICALYWRSLKLFQEINRDVLIAPGLVGTGGDHTAGKIYGTLGLLVIVFIAGTAAGILVWAHFS